VDAERKFKRNKLPRQLKYTLRAHQGHVLAMVFDISGEYLLSAGEDRMVRLWSVQDGTLVKKFPIVHNSAITDILLSRDRKTFITSDRDGRVLMWKTLKGSSVRTLYGPNSQVTSLAWSEDESILVCGTVEGCTYIWDLSSKSHSPIQVLSHNSYAVSSVLVNEPFIGTASADGTLRIFDVQNARVLERSFGRTSIGSLSLSKDRRMFLVGCLDHTLRLIDRKTGEELMCYRGHQNQGFYLKSHLPWDNSLVLSPSEDGRAYLWNLVEGTIAASLKHGDKPVLCAASHPKNRVLATAGADGTIKLWE